MAEASGTGRVDDHEVRRDRLEVARRDMEDAMVVMAHLEKKSSERIKEHAELVAGHAEFIASHELPMREFDEKLNALIKIVGNMQGGIESRA
jgi:hypothetical protein